MRRKTLLGLFTCGCLALLALLPLLAACAQPAPAPAPAPKPTPAPAPAPAPAPTPAPAPKPAPITLKAVTFGKLSLSSCYLFEQLMKRVNEQLAGEFKIEYLGGPEVIPARQQVEAARSGVADIVVLPISYYKDSMAEGDAIPLSTITWAEERKRGYLDLFRQLHKERLNLYLFAGTNKGAYFGLFTSKPVATLKDLNGMRFRTEALYDPLFKALGIVGVSMPAEDIYTGMDRKMVDGYAYKPPMALTLKLEEVTKYYIDHMMWGGGSVQILFNMSKWDSIPKSVQDKLHAIQMKLEPEVEAYLVQDDQKALDKMKSLGIKPIKFPDADAKTFNATVTDVMWAELQKNVKPDIFAKLQAMLKN